jgi:hypothetical protein
MESMRAVLLTLTTCLLVLPVQAKYSGGSGTAQDPYQIATAADLIAHLGLFGQLGSKGEVRNPGLVDVNIAGLASYVGALVAWNYGTVTRCYNTGAVRGSERIGGLVGINSGDVIQCYSTSAVKNGGQYAGGLVGGNYGAVVHCYGAGTVSGSSWVGGLVGTNYCGYEEPLVDGYIVSSYSTATVSGEAGVGGIVSPFIGSKRIS